MYPDSVTTTIGRIAIVILVALSYPLQSNPARQSFNHVAYYIHESNLARSVRSLRKSMSRSASVSTFSSNTSSGVIDERRSLISIRQQAQLQQQLQQQLQENVFLEDSNNETPFIDDTDIVREEIHESGAGEKYVELTNMKLIVITTIIVILSYLISISVDSLARVLAIVGATGSTSISFILPGFFTFKLLGSDGTLLSFKDRVVKYCALALSIWGIIVMIVCLTATLFLDH
ncbi:unnamed protein product [Ambrosiozyma monospora]|uniref:Unnamed protein product n=1 Tax=Ambrosiozyma monospora TaxID=43982 RepID=A0A9W6Z088_AMBMO|nr:unnamed protein product [Ambrosiozyma monospora]